MKYDTNDAAVNNKHTCRIYKSNSYKKNKLLFYNPVGVYCFCSFIWGEGDDGWLFLILIEPRKMRGNFDYSNPVLPSIQQRIDILDYLATKKCLILLIVCEENLFFVECAQAFTRRGLEQTMSLM